MFLKKAGIIFVDFSVPAFALLSVQSPREGWSEFSGRRSKCTALVSCIKGQVHGRTQIHAALDFAISIRNASTITSTGPEDTLGIDA